MGENNGNKIVRSNNSGGGNLRGIGGGMMVDKSSVQCYIIKSLAILKENAMLTRNNLKKMKL